MAEVCWIDDFDLRIDGETVLLISKSGGQERPCRFSRSLLRRYVEMGIRILDEAEQVEREARNVVPLRAH